MSCNFHIIRRVLALFSTLILLVTLVSCSVNDPKNPRFIVAKGKGVKITRSDLDAAKHDYLMQSGMDPNQVPKEMMGPLEQQILDQRVTQALLLNEGTSLTIPDLDKQVDERVKQLKSRFKDQKEFEGRLSQMGITEDKIRKDVKDQITINEVFKKAVPQPADPAPQEIEKFYKENPKYFAEPKQVKVSHVLVKVEPNATAQEKADKKKQIEKARARVAKGEDFAKVAKEVSEDPGSAANGGALGDFFPEGKMVPEFDKVAFNSKLNDISPVFESSFGFHFLKVTDIKQARQVPLQEATPMISKYLKQKQQKTSVETYIAKLKTNADVKLFLPETPKVDTQKTL
jgi:peptidyl-prolyl cis-trans isomerase C